MDVRERSRRHARNERRRVELVICVKNQRHVQRMRGQPARTVAGQHVKKVRGVAEHRIRCDDPAAGGKPRGCGQHGCQLGSQPDARSVPTLRGLVFRIGIVVRQRGHQRSQRVHGIVRRQRPHETQHALGQRPRRRQLRLKLTKLPAVRQPPVPQQKTDFFERRLRRQIVYVVAAIGQHSARAVQIADGGRRCDNVLEPGFGCDCCRHG